jgi:hypothetical protein
MARLVVIGGSGQVARTDILVGMSANFLMGVYTCALLHFGYQSVATWDQTTTGAPPLPKFKLEELDGTQVVTANSTA